MKRLTFKTKPEDLSWQQILDFFVEGENIEAYDGGWLFDHFYPIYSDQSGPCFEGWTALSFLAGKTSRLRLGLMVGANPYRHPALLANMAATFDVFSGGRLDLGLGAGWYDDEANAYGMPLLPIGRRLDQLEESCRVLKSLLTNEQTTFSGDHYQLTDAYCSPKPVQKPHPPLVMGGTGEKRMLKIVASYADDWNYPGGEVADFKRKLEKLHEHCEAVGRDPREIMVSSHIMAGETAGATAETAALFCEAGVEHCCVYFMDGRDPGVLGTTAEVIFRTVG